MHLSYNSCEQQGFCFTKILLDNIRFEAEQKKAGHVYLVTKRLHVMEISIKPLENKAECKQVLSSMWFYSGIPCIDEVVYFIAPCATLRTPHSHMEM